MSAQLSRQDYGVIAVVVAVVGTMLGGVAILKARGDATPTAEAGTVASPAPTPEPTREPTLVDQIAEARGIGQAVAVVRGSFDDTSNTVSDGAQLLAGWAASRMTWPDLQQQAETTHAEMMKDSLAERGKRICARGTVTQITVDRSAGVPLNVGVLMTNSYKVLHFIAVRSAGRIVEDTPARFCGITTGRFDYANVSGGTTLAVQAVGMFDLPENKR